MEEIEVASELEEDFIQKELIAAYKDHIETLKAEVKRLKDKYEPKLLAAAYSPPSDKLVPLNRKPKVTSVTQLIKILEQRTKVNEAVKNAE